MVVLSLGTEFAECIHLYLRLVYVLQQRGNEGRPARLVTVIVNIDMINVVIPNINRNDRLLIYT